MSTNGRVASVHTDDPSNCIPCPIVPGWTDIYTSGERVQRYEGDWRDSIDLATADRETMYAAGLADGYRRAQAEMWDLHRLLCEWLEVLP